MPKNPFESQDQVKRSFPRGKVPRQTLNRWLKEAKDEDPDLEIIHHLNRRRWKPGVYTDWRPVGKIILGPTYDPLLNRITLDGVLGIGDTNG